MQLLQMLITTASRASNAITIVLTVISRANLNHLNLEIQHFGIICSFTGKAAALELNQF